jgi:hypothetical protein
MSHVLRVTIIVATLALTACGVLANPYTAEQIVSESFDVGIAPHIVVETFNGAIEVFAGEGGAVQADVTKRGAGGSQTEAEDDLNNIDVSFQQDGDTLRIIARRTDNRRDVGNSGAAIELRVPADAVLDLSTSNGEINVGDVIGNVTARTSNGRIEVNGGAGAIDLQTSNGAIDIDAIQAAVQAHTSNGAIGFAGTLRDGAHRLETSNGAIVITLPADAQFHIDADTSNGDVSCEFPVTVTGSRDNELHGRVGDNPSMSIAAHTSNGSIQLNAR